MIEKSIKKKIIFPILGILCIFWSQPVSGEQALTQNMTLPDLQLISAGSIEVQNYLGLKSLEPFSLSQIQSKLILVEFYSIYCAVCQQQAPHINKLFKYVQGDRELSKDLKMIGIGLGNKPFEVKYYREAHSVKFPLFPDADKGVLNKTGIKATPVMVLMQPSGKILMAHYGRIENLDNFFQEIKKIQNAL